MKLNGTILQESGSTEQAESEDRLPEAAGNLSPTPQAQGIWQMSAPENHPQIQESIFLLLRGYTGGDKLLQNENKCHSNWSVNCSPSSLEHGSVFQPSFLNPKFGLSRFKKGIK